MNAIAPMTTAHPNPNDIALKALWEYRGHDRAAALGSSIKQLVSQHDISQPAAEIAAIQAFADLDSVNTSARIDIDASTSHVVVLRDAGGRPTMLTVRDLAKVVQQARDAGLVSTVDAAASRPALLDSLSD